MCIIMLILQANGSNGVGAMHFSRGYRVFLINIVIIWTFVCAKMRILCCVKLYRWV